MIRLFKLAYKDASLASDYLCYGFQTVNMCFLEAVLKKWKT